jgi:hypothetical protein
MEFTPEFAARMNRLTPEQIAQAMETVPTDVLEQAIRFEALSHPGATATADPDTKIRDAVAKHRSLSTARCRVCGCTEREPCNPPCAWMGKEDLCTTCATAVAALVEWAEAALRANMSALMREYQRQARQGQAYRSMP